MNENGLKKGIMKGNCSKDRSGAVILSKKDKKEEKLQNMNLNQDLKKNLKKICNFFIFIILGFNPVVKPKVKIKLNLSQIREKSQLTISNINTE